jgi:hypothetical protein
MSLSPYLGNYGIQSSNDDFVLTFEIPDNCLYTKFTTIEGVNTILVELKPDQKDPNPDLVSFQETFECDLDGLLGIDFELPDDYLGGTLPGTTKKPRIRVTSLM